MSVVCSPIVNQTPLNPQLAAKPCQSFPLRLILGVPILKEDSQFVNNLSIIFSKFLHGLPDNLAELGAGQLNLGRDNLWCHTVIGINPVLKQLEDSALNESVSHVVDFAIVLLDFSWLNSELGHHLAHLCASLPYTSLLSVSPSGKLAQLICKPGQSPPKISCLAIRPILRPYSSTLSPLLDFMAICSSLTGKPLPPSFGDVLPEPASLLPILIPQPQPPRSLSSTIPNLQKTTPKPNASILIQKALDTSKSYLPRPTVRHHVPADDWLTFKLDHATLYKCGPEISKELEEHSLYIHDVADIWALYPHEYQKVDTHRLSDVKGKRRKTEEENLLDEDYMEPRQRKSLRGDRINHKNAPIRRYDIKSQRRPSNSFVNLS